MKRRKKNRTINEQKLKIQVTKRMQPCIGSSMHLIEDMDFSMRSRTRVMVRSPYNVRLVEERIARDILHNIRVVDRISTMHRRHIWWGMLDIILHGSLHR